MKKVFALILALCLVAVMLPMAVMAEETTETTETTTPAETTAPESVKVTIRYDYKKSFSLTVKPGEVAYATTSDNVISKHTDAEAPADNYLKLEYSAEEPATLKATFSNFNADCTLAGGYTAHGIEFPAGEYAVAVELIGENSMRHGKSACIKYHNAGGMTITGAGSLALNLGTAEEVSSASSALWANGGDLLIKDTTVNFDLITSGSSKHHAILLSGKNNITFDGAKVNINACGGQLAYLADGTAKTNVVRYTLDPSADRLITIKNSEIIAKIKQELVISTAPAVIENTSITVTSGAAPIFNPTPTFVGDYTALGGAKESTAKEYEITTGKLWSSCKYMKLTPGKSSGSSSSGSTGTTDSSNPGTGDSFNVVLVSALALVSAVSVAGVTFVGKKRV